MAVAAHEEEASPLPVGELAFKAVGVKKHYPGVKALDGVDLEGYAGSVLGACELGRGRLPRARQARLHP